MSSAFSSKWGINQDEIERNEGNLNTVCLHFVIIVIIFVLLRPEFLMKEESLLKVSRLSWTRVLMFSVVVVIFTYFFPFLVKYIR